MDAKLNRIFQDAAAKGVYDRNSLERTWDDIASKFSDDTVFEVNKGRDNYSYLEITVKSKKTSHAVSVKENQDGTLTLVKDKKDRYNDSTIEDVVEAWGYLYGRVTPPRPNRTQSPS